MGSSEFEGETLDIIRRFISSFIVEYHYQEVKVKFNDVEKSVYCFCHKEDDVFASQHIINLACNEKSEYCLKESIHLHQNLFGVIEYNSMKHDFWLDIGQAWGRNNYPKRFTANYPFFFMPDKDIFFRIIFALVKEKFKTPNKESENVMLIHKGKLVKARCSTYITYADNDHKIIVKNRKLSKAIPIEDLIEWDRDTEESLRKIFE